MSEIMFPQKVPPCLKYLLRVFQGYKLVKRLGTAKGKIRGPTGSGQHKKYGFAFILKYLKYSLWNFNHFGTYTRTSQK